MCIIDQIQTRQEEKLLQDEMKEQEGQQLLENMERMQMEELKVHNGISKSLQISSSCFKPQCI